MTTAFRPIACILLLAAACGRTPPPPSAPVTDPAPAGTPRRFTGELVLAGALSRATDGAVIVTLRRIGDARILWRRSYEVGDPWWTERPGSRTLPFGMSARDAIVDPAPELSVEMELVARFDPDGDPETLETDAFETKVRARTGATDLVLTLGRPVAGFHAGPDISRSADGKAPVPRADGER
jgi:hypothetical protein